MASLRLKVKKPVLVFLLLLLIAGLFVSLIKISEVQALTTVFSDNFEDGTTDAWTTVFEGTGDSVTVEAASAESGSYGVNCTTDASATHGAYLDADIGSEYFDLTVQFQWRIDNGSDTWKTVLRIYASDGVNPIVSLLQNGNYWRTYYRNGSTSTYEQQASAVSLATFYNLTVYVDSDEVTFYKDSVVVSTFTDINADYYGSPDEIRIGVLDVGSIVLSFDEVLVTSIVGEGSEYDYIQEDLSGDYNVTAVSLSRDDIQAAVDNVYANGVWETDSLDRSFIGNVFLPSGFATWSDGEYVNMPYGGIRIYGPTRWGCSDYPTLSEYTGTATLNKTWEGGTFFYFGVDTFGKSYYPNASIIAGVKMIRSSPTDGTNEVNGVSQDIAMKHIPGFRVYFCTMDNAGTGVAVSALSGGVDQNCSCYGVIDHCRFDNTYKIDVAGWTPYWGYGIIAGGNYRSDSDWQVDSADFFGVFGWFKQVGLAYVEDCYFSRSRHCTSANMGGYVVVRYSLADNSAAGYGVAYWDIHGSTAAVISSRGQEVYNCTMYGAPGNLNPWGTTHYSIGIQERGGSGIFANNTMVCDTNSAYNYFIYLQNDDTGNDHPTTHVQDCYIWDNSYTNCSFLKNEGGYTEEVEYFLRAPSYDTDGFDYNPYVHPHPYVSGEALPEEPEPEPSPSPTPTPTPTETPFMAGSSNSTLYFRSDVYVTNTVTGYGLDLVNTASSINKTDTGSGNVMVRYGFRVWKVDLRGEVSELTSGSPVAVMNRTEDGEGWQSNTWLCSDVTFQVGYDSLKVIAYMKFGTGSWQSELQYTTDRLVNKGLEESTWTFYVYTARNASSDTTGKIVFGSSSYESGIFGVSFVEATPQEIALALGLGGDWITMALYPFLYVMGNLFYGLILLFCGGAYYLRYKRWEPVLILIILFGGAGALGYLIPNAAFRLLYVVVLFVIAIILYRVFH